MLGGALPGFRDFYPEDFARRQYIFTVWRTVVSRFGFVEYDGPPLEPLELYTKKSGDEIVGQLYAFTDRGGREVALRPEMTPTLARMVAARAATLRKPVRWFSIPQLFRYERQQKGRLREHFQLNVDIVGESAVAADAELLAIAVEVVRAFGLGPADVEIRLSDRELINALLDAWGLPERARHAAYAAIDKLEREEFRALVERLSEAGVDRVTAERVLEGARASDIEEVKRLAKNRSDLRGPLERMETCLELLAAHGVREWVTVDLSIVRGLAYYTGIVFEMFDRSRQFRAICGGGRYDRLLADLGGVDLPALGFGMGDVVLGELLRARGLLTANESAPQVWVAFPEEQWRSAAVAAAAYLRRAGLSVEYSLRPQSLSRQLKSASARGVRYTLIVTSHVSPNAPVELRDMVDSSQRSATLASIAEEFAPPRRD
ncbi:MAG TPA: histidine--tRNA ligase [Gemmatimonadaceae bacterium]|nr:histidine--tRNA ligase [Gemmatimonadaceae bacterium]